MYKYFYFKIEIKTKVDSYMPCEAMAHSPKYQWWIGDQSQSKVVVMVGSEAWGKELLCRPPLPEKSPSFLYRASPIWALLITVFGRSGIASVAMAKANVFRKNGINVGRKFAKIMKILDKIDDVKSRGVIFETETFSVLVIELFPISWLTLTS